jgi:hypothetical protein
MADNSNKNNNREVKEVLVKTEKDTSTKATTFEERVKVEAEVTMIKIGKNAQGQAKWVRSDRITDAQKKERNLMLEKIRNGQSY